MHFASLEVAMRYLQLVLVLFCFASCATTGTMVKAVAVDQQTVSSDAPAIGHKDAPVLILEFTDFQ